MKVLIIDDEAGILKMYQEYLSLEGFEVTTALNGDDGIKKAEEIKPDVILLDIIMPKLNGLDVLKTLKANPDIKNTPVFLLTNLPEECSGDKARELGASGYLVKAKNDPKMIIDVIKGAIKKS